MTRISDIVRELDRLAPGAKSARGDARARIVERLAVLDRELMEAALGDIDDSTAGSLREEASAELAAFGSRMPPDVRVRASEAAFERLVRESLRLPTLAYD